ncbi:MAG: flagellin [Myxococcota bacterium]|jgi:flagellin
MSLSLVTNTASMVGQRNINKTHTRLNKSLNRLTTGRRINSAMDDAAGLGVSEAMRAQIRGLAQASRNANDGLSVVQTAESAMGEISNMLIRMRELTVQAASDTLNDSERSYLDTEFQDLVSEIDRVSSTTLFNGNVLTDGSFAVDPLDFQVGFENGADFRISVTIDDVSTSGLGFLGAEAVGTKLDAQDSMDILDAALTAVSTSRSLLGSRANRLVAASAGADVMRENLSAANSRIRDTDVAAETSQMARSQVLMQAGTSMLAQANAQTQLAMQLIGG